MFFKLFLPLLLFLPSLALANPGHRDPDACLKVHGLCGNAAELISASQGIWSEVEHDLAELNIIKKEQRWADAKEKQLAKVWFAGYELMYNGRLLKLMGEPAGIDVAMRGNLLHSIADPMAKLYGASPTGAKTRSKAKDLLTRSKKKRMAKLQKVGQLRQRGDLVQAERLYRESERELWKDLMWFPSRTSYTRPYTPHANALTPLDEKRKAENAAKLREVITSQTPDLDALTSQVKAAVSGVAKSGACEIDGQTLRGPDALAKCYELWQSAHIRLVRCQGLEWSLRSIDGTASNQDADIWVQRVKTLSEEMLATIPQFIAADVSRVQAAEVASLYVAYLKSLAPIIRRTSDPKFSEACKKNLGELVAKGGPLVALTENYRKGTEELLAWRHRLAASQAMKLRPEFPPLVETFVAGNRSFSGYVGLREPVSKNRITPTLRKHIPHVVPVAVKKLLEKQVTVRDLRRLPGGGRFTMSAYRERVFANVPTNMDLAKQTDALRSDLLVSSSQPPLTLKAAMAIDSAERIDLQAVGGVIKGLYLESPVTRFATFPEAAVVLLPLPTFPTDGESSPLMGMDQMMMRFDVLPVWIQHDYFLVKL